jgi:hypothetical protein
MAVPDLDLSRSGETSVVAPLASHSFAPPFRKRSGFQTNSYPSDAALKGHVLLVATSGFSLDNLGKGPSASTQAVTRRSFHAKRTPSPKIAISPNRPTRR